MRLTISHRKVYKLINHAREDVATVTLKPDIIGAKCMQDTKSTHTRCNFDCLGAPINQIYYHLTELEFSIILILCLFFSCRCCTLQKTFSFSQLLLDSYYPKYIVYLQIQIFWQKGQGNDTVVLIFQQCQTYCATYPNTNHQVIITQHSLGNINSSLSFHYRRYKCKRNI